MLVRWRRLLRSCRNNTYPPKLTLRSSSSAHSRLSPDIVDSTVSNCPSDTIAFTFFLWAAGQPNYFHTPASFDRIVPVVLRLTLRFGLVSSILRNLQSFGCDVKAQTFLILLRIYWRANKFLFALEVFDEMCRRNYKPNTYVGNIVLDIHFKMGKFDEAMRIFGGIKSPNFLTFNIALGHFCLSGYWIGVRVLLREMVRRAFLLNEGTFAMASDCFCKAGRQMELLQLLAFMVVVGRSLSVNLWTILINSFCTSGRMDMAYEHLRKMIEAGCSPTVVTYTSIIRGLCEAQMYGNVTDILSIMHSNDCPPDLVLYNVMIFYLLKNGRHDVAIDVLILLLKRKMEPDSYTCSSLAFTFLSSREISLLLDLTAGFKFEDDLVFYNSLITGFFKVDLPSEALNLYDMMIVRELVPDSYTFVGLLGCLCRLGRPELAVYAYHEILVSNPDVDPHVHSAMLDGLVKNRRFNAAVRLFREAVSRNFRVDVVSYTIAVQALSKSGRIGEALDLFERMKHFGPAPNIYTYNVMLCGLCKSRDLGGTKRLVKDMVLAGIEMDHISMNAIDYLLMNFGWK